MDVIGPGLVSFRATEKGGGFRTCVRLAVLGESAEFKDWSEALKKLDAMGMRPYAPRRPDSIGEWRRRSELISPVQLTLVPKLFNRVLSQPDPHTLYNLPSVEAGYFAPLTRILSIISLTWTRFQ